jgi:hypothetical protein
MKLMGHSSITVSQRYVHPTSDSMKRAISGLELGRVGAMAVVKRKRKAAQQLDNQ